MKILVTGANGMLGQDLCPILEDSEFDVVETDTNNLDITDKKQVKDVITKEKPDAIIHCAAYTNVDKAEEDTETAMKINVEGTENIARICAEKDIILVYISTDYVFDGTKTAPYTPEDKPNPLNKYGLSKLKGEEVVIKNCKKYYITRTSWLYGHHGKNFVETMISLAGKPELKVVNDQIGSPTWTIELANGIVNLLNNKADYGIYHISGSGKTNWYEFAKEIFEIMGLKVNLKPCASDEYKCAAKRPKDSYMDNKKSCRSWKAALKDYIALRD